MDILANIGSINYLAVGAATLASFVTGFVWYHQKVFGTMWMQFEGLTIEDAEKGNMGKIFGLTLVARFILGMVLALLIGGAGLVDGVVMGLLISVGIVATNSLMHHLFAQKCFTRWGIEVGYDILTIVIMAAIIGVR